MAARFWRVRGKQEYFDPYSIYPDTPTFFTIQIFHGGHFSNSPGREYVNGKTTFIDSVDYEDFGSEMLTEMMHRIEYPSDMVFYYFFKTPYVCLDLGLNVLTIDSDFKSLCDHVRGGVKLIEIYVEHWHSNVLTISLDEDDPSSPILAIENRTEVYENRTDDDDEDDPDYIEDEDNEVEDVEVDMLHFRSCVDFDEEILDDDASDNDSDRENDIQVDLENFDSNSDNDLESTTLKKVHKRIIRKKKRSSIGTDASVNPFYIGQLIEEKQKLNEMVKNFALQSRRQLYIGKNEALRYRIICLGSSPNLDIGEVSKGLGESSTSVKVDQHKKVTKRKTKPTCPFAIQISRPSITDLWCVKTINLEHKCLHTRDVGLYTMSFIAKEIEPMVQSNPEIPLVALQDVIQKKHKVQVSLEKVFRAKTIAAKKLFGDYAQQYTLLRSYCDELLKANPGSTVKIDVDPCCNPSLPTRQFRRIYICFDAMKKGFKMCGREILGLDGCFMKGPYPGQILSAVGVDGNNGIYPVAFSLVEAETRQSWIWFLELLRDDFDLPLNANFTFISDRQKGLIPALGNVFPNAEHRFCLRHIQENMKKKWRGDVYKNMLWRAASVTSLPYFNSAMDDIRKEDASLYEWLKLIPPNSWSKAHFSGRAKCDMLLNNICEVFNKQLIGARDKPVITCLEYIREYMTKRIVNVKKIQAKCKGPLTPTATAIFNGIKNEASQLNVLMVDSSKYQVSGPRSQCVVNVDQKTCSCRKWDLTGMPCKHAVAAIWDMARNDMRVGIPENWVSEVYWLDTWKKVYNNIIEPMTGPSMWTPSQCPTKLIPPKHHTQVGRPKKMRKKSIEEVQEVFSSNGKMTRKGNTTTCQKCKNKGHNSRTCKGQGGNGSQQESQNATQGAPQPSQETQVNV